MQFQKLATPYFSVSSPKPPLENLGTLLLLFKCLVFLFIFYKMPAILPSEKKKLRETIVRSLP